MRYGMILMFRFDKDALPIIGNPKSCRLHPFRVKPKRYRLFTFHPRPKEQLLRYPQTSLFVIAVAVSSQQ